MKKILSFFSFLISMTAVSQDWQRLPGPIGTEVNALITFDNKIYAGTYSGIFTSTDQGQTWQPDLNGMDGDMYIWSMAANGNTLIAATSVGVFYKTPGNPWQISQMLNIMMKVVSNGTVFLAKAYSNFNVYRSTDGIHWTTTGHSTGAMGVNGATFFLDTTAAILRSANGVNWQPVSHSMPGYGFSAIQGDGNVMFASRFEGGVYRSTNNGDSFTQVTIPTNSTFPYRAHNFSFDGQIVYANIFSQVDEIYFSTDYGMTWQKRNPGLTPSVFGWGGMITESDYQLVAAYEGIYRSINGGADWIFDCSSGLANATVTQLLFNQGKMHALTGSDVSGSFGCYSSDNLGQTWNATATQHFGRNANVRFGTVVNNTLLVKNGFTLSRSTDNGTSWTNILTAPDNMKELFTSGTRVLMATDMNKAYYSDNSGLTWTQSPTANATVNCFTAKDGIVFAGTSTGIQKSVNNGATWTNLPAVIAGPYDVVSMVSNNMYLFAAIQSGGAYIQLYRSADNGQTWTNISASLPQGVWSTLAVNGTTLMTASNPVGVDSLDPYLYRSNDNGSTWQSFRSGMFVDSDIIHLSYAENKWWAGTETAGLWAFGEDVLGQPETIASRQIKIVPNPVADITNILLPDSTTGLAKISIFDIGGRLVTRLSAPAAERNVMIDMSAFESGNYFIEVTDGTGTSTHKIVKK